MNRIANHLAIALLTCGVPPAICFAQASNSETGGHDWSQFGGTINRNMVSMETDLPDSFEIGDGQTRPRNIKWVAQFRGNYVGANNPAIANGKVYMGLKSMQSLPKDRNKNYMPFSCLDEKTGRLLWQLNSTGTSNGRTSTIGNTTCPTVDGNRVYCYRRNLIVCLAADGFTGENQGPFKDELKEYGLGQDDLLDETDADIVWFYDVYEQLNVKITHCLVYAPLVYGNYVYCSSGNSKTGGDDGRAALDSKNAPCFIVLDKNTGKLVAQENEKIGYRNLRGQWGASSVAMVNGKVQILFSGGDGIVYAFEPVPDKPAGEGVASLKKIWSFDLNAHWNYKNIRTTVAPAAVSQHQEATADQYAKQKRKEFLLGAPVCHNNHVYIALSADWGSGTETWTYWPNGRLVCIDAAKTGDITETGLIWENTEIGLSEATVSISDSLLYTTDIYGKVHCIDEQTGKTLWSYDTQKPVYSSTMVADGKVYVGNSKGDFFILKAGKEMQLLFQTKLKGAISGSMAVANKTLYITAGDKLFAIQKTEIGQ